MVQSNQSLNEALNFKLEVSHDLFWFKNEFYAIIGAVNKNSFNIYKLPFFSQQENSSLTKAKAIYIQTICIFQESTCEYDKTEEKVLVKWAQVSSNYFPKAH